MLLAALDSQALTLGRMRGAALIGQALDVSVQVQTDPEDGPASLCFEAEVFHADVRQDPSRVQLSIEPSAPGQTANVRIRSSIAVDEPVVTIYLRAGCSQKISRRYVMLADIVSESAAPVQVAQVPLLAPPSAPASGTTTSDVGAGTTAALGNPGSPPTKPAPVVGATPVNPAPAVRRKAPAKPAPVAAPRKPSAPAKALAPSASSAPQTSEKLAAGRAAGQSRLKLDPLEMLSERVATLESSTASAPAELAAREARDAQRLLSLEASVKNLLAVAARNESNLAELRLRLQQAEADRYTNPLVLGLVALLLACVAGIAFLLGRRGSGTGGGNWWSASSNAPNTVAAGDIATRATGRSGYAPISAAAPLSAPDSLPVDEPEVQVVERAAPPPRVAPITQVDVSLVEMSESTFDRLMQSGTTHSAVRKTRPPELVAGAGVGAGATRRLINADELFDIRQQAEFFVSLGQTDQAVRILENRISESGESSPLAYLDLLKIFHSLGLKADFRQVREDFVLLFNGRLQEFAGFDNEGQDLEAYPEILDRLAQTWGTADVLPLIEALVFREPSSGEGELLDMAAFRDLLLLHAVAQVAETLPDQLFEAVGRSIPRSPFSNSARPVNQTPASQLQLVAETEASANQPLPSLTGLAEVDIDLTDITTPEPAPVEPPVELSAASNPDPGNLIDFDLPILPDVAAEKAKKA